MPNTETFYINTTSVGTLFNVTVMGACPNGTDAWQVQVGFDPTQLQAIRVVYTAGSTSQLFSGHLAELFNPIIDNIGGSVLLAEMLLGFDYVNAASASLFYITFNITAAPAPGQTLSSLIDPGYGVAYVNQFILESQTVEYPDGIVWTPNTAFCAYSYISTVPAPLLVSISPLSTTIRVGQTIHFTSNITGGYYPYTCQWYLNGAPVSGAIGATWAFTPASVGSNIVYDVVNDSATPPASAKSSNVSVTAVQPWGSSTSFVFSSYSVSTGSPVTCTATVLGSNPTGTVTWSTTSSSGYFGQSVFTLSGGNCLTTYTDTRPGEVIITATYSGDAYNFPSSCSVSLIENPSAPAPSYAPAFVISPASELLNVNDSFIITVNLTNAQNMFSWQIVLKYNATDLRLNDMWIPDDNVFAGYDVNLAGPITADDVDGSSLAAMGNSLLGENQIANVNSGVLCKANFTVINTGQSLLEVKAVKLNPADTREWYSFWYNATPNSQQIYEQKALGTNCTVFTVAPPHARFTYSPSAPWAGATVAFDASSSTSDNGTILSYNWDFGDSNLTTTSDPIITHTYSAGGPYNVTLTVADSEGLIDSRSQTLTVYVQITFDQAGIGSDFTGTALTVDGAGYGVSDLPQTFLWEVGSTHSYAYQSPLIIGPGLKPYFCNSTTGLSTLQSTSINITGPGSITGNYATDIHDVIITEITTNNTWVYQGQTANINVTVSNIGDVPENVWVTLYYNLTAGKSIDAYPTYLNTGQSYTLLFTWNTAGAQCLNYTLAAVATIPTGSNTLSNGTITVRLIGDVNGDGRVNMKDIALIARDFGSTPASPKWNAALDMNGDGKIDMKDIALVARHFGQQNL